MLFLRHINSDQGVVEDTALRLHKFKSMQKNNFLGIKMTSENEAELREALKRMGVAPEVVDALKYGTYVYDGNNFRKLSKAELLAHENPEYGVVALAGFAAATKVIWDSNAELNTEKYKGKNKDEKPTGKGYAFEDLNNRAFRKVGYKVDSSIGKKEHWGGADAKVIDKDGNVFFIQYKCYANPTQAAQSIAAKGGYRGQKIWVNPEVFEVLKKKLRWMETKGEVPKGTADRVFVSPITFEESEKVAAPFNGDNWKSLQFDAGTAAKTGIVVAIVAAGVALAINTQKEGRINKKVVKKTIAWGLGIGTLAFLTHICINQIKRN